MSVSLRNRRVALFALSESVGGDGTPSTSYVRTWSSDTDGLWWASRATPTGRETTVGMAQATGMQAVFGFSAHSPVAATGLVRDEDGRYWLVETVLDRDYGRDDLQVLASYRDHAQLSYTIVENTPDPDPEPEPDPEPDPEPGP